MKIAYFIILFLAMNFCFSQQQWVANATDSITITADTYLGNDQFGTSYFIDNNVLIKKNKLKTWQYKNESLGKIAKTDLQNPLTILLFYQSFNTVVLLDDQLNEIRKINFSENTTPIVASAAGLASGNRLWLFNSLTQQMGLWDYSKNEFKIITAPFKGILKYYEADFNYFQWVDEKCGWYRCDVYGKITVIGKIPDFDGVQFIGADKLIYQKGNKLYYFDMGEKKTNLIDFGEKTFESFSYKDQILSIFTKHGITNYKIILP